VLNLKSVGINENFFDIGGHSINSTTILFKSREKFKIDIPVESLLLYPTIETFGKFILEVKEGVGKSSSKKDITEIMLNDSVIDESLIPQKDVTFEWKDSFLNPKSLYVFL
jgi:acyl carrier protein